MAATKTFQETAICPNCLEIGKLQYQHGVYRCDKCTNKWTYTFLDEFKEAFEKGREYERRVIYGSNKTVGSTTRQA